MIREKEELKELFKLETAFQEDIEDAAEHGCLVSNLAYLLAKELNFDESFCELMSDAGMVHDVGKLQLGAYLYGRRENALNIEELRYVRMHPNLGCEYLKEKGTVSNAICEAVKHHHENYDGSGYPDNIKGSDIPTASRILRICDVYSALVSHRPYRDAFDKDTAVTLMIDEVKNFDMQFFLAFMSVIHDPKFSEIDDFVTNMNSKHSRMKNA